MKIEDGQTVLFSVKCFVAAMLAYYVALRIGLIRPYWAVTTSYIVAQPFAGAVLSKAVFRLMGTILGATAAVALVPSFVNEPAVLVCALALWLSFCLYLSLLDRTPRSYIFLLAGYTATIIGIPSVEAPGTIFTTAILRVQEITIGILSAGLIHGMVFPRTITARLLQRIDHVLDDASAWSRASLAGMRDAALGRRRRRVALDILELHLLSIHLPFDTARLLPRVRTVRALQHQISLLLPLASAVEDRLAELQACEGGVPPAVQDLVDRTGAWIADGLAHPDRSETGAALIAEAQSLEPIASAPDEASLVWRDMLQLNLLARIGDLIAALRDCHDLRDQIRSPSARPISPRVGEMLAAAGERPLHRDRGLALRDAFGSFATIALGSAFWIATAWPDGGGALVIAGICCALFANLDDPGPTIARVQLGSTFGLVMAIVYGYAILPRTTDFVTLAAAVAPMLLLMGAVMGTPQTAAIGIGIAISFPQTVGFNAVYQDSYPASLNGAIAQFIGIAFATVTMGLFQTIGTEQSAARLLRGGWQDVARQARGQVGEGAAWISRMLDRVGLLIPRLTTAGTDDGEPMQDALKDLRVGMMTGQLGALAPEGTSEEKTAIAATLAGIDRHFTRLARSGPDAPGPVLLGEIDGTVAAFAADPDPGRRRAGLVTLTSLRRDLYPRAAAYVGTGA
ncbi:FUSC family protein [Sphingomonas sp. MMS24-J13]|uniref:FUSC family protein n=1 Tax=Sphingomonas sp. MMS24-J13 TaxID=3238686 RepID=UPI00384DE716